MLKRFLFYFVSILILILIGLMSFWLSLSEEKLQSWSQHQLNKMSPQQMRTVIQGMRTCIWGLEIGQIELTNPSRKESIFNISNIKARFNIIAILFSQELPFSFDLYGGSGVGALGLFPGSRIRLSAKNVELNWIPVVRRSQLLKSNPVISLSGVFTPLSKSGKLQFEIKQLKLSGDKSVTTLTVNLPDTQLDSVTGNIALNGRQLEMAVDMTGDITASLAGKIMGDWNRIQHSKVDIKLKADMKNSYRDQLGLLNNILDSYRSGGRQISIHLTGNLMFPQIKKI